MEKETSLLIKHLKIDRGGEFNLAEVNDYGKQHEVKRQLNTDYTL